MKCRHCLTDIRFGSPLFNPWAVEEWLDMQDTWTCLGAPSEEGVVPKHEPTLPPTDDVEALRKYLLD